MNPLKKLFGRGGSPPVEANHDNSGAPSERGFGFEAASNHRITGDMISHDGTIDEALSCALESLRGRSLNEHLNNPYVASILREIENNILGHDGMEVQFGVRNVDGRNGKVKDLDVETNQMLSKLWKKQCSIDNASIDGQSDHREVMGTALMCCALQGFSFIRIYDNAPNETGFALQAIEGRQLAVNYHTEYRNGVEVTKGIERDQYGRHLAYYFHRLSSDGLTYFDQDRIPASEVVFIRRRSLPGQILSQPWLANALVNLHRLAAYERAELVKREVTSNNVAFFSDREDAEPDSNFLTKNPDGSQRAFSAPGTGMDVGKKEVHIFDPKHDGNFPEFRKAQLRAAGAGQGIQYTTLGNDLENVNLSSIRHGRQDAIEEWLNKQHWWSARVEEVIVNKWLSHMLITDRVPGHSLASRSKLAHFQVIGRRWAFPEPEKDIRAIAMQLQLRLTSLQRVASQMGITDLDALQAEIDAEREKYGELNTSFIKTMSPEEVEAALSQGS